MPFRSRLAYAILIFFALTTESSNSQQRDLNGAAPQMFFADAQAALTDKNHPLHEWVTAIAPHTARFEYITQPPTEDENGKPLSALEKMFLRAMQVVANGSGYVTSGPNNLKLSISAWHVLGFTLSKGAPKFLGNPGEWRFTEPEITQPYLDVAATRSHLIFSDEVTDHEYDDRRMTFLPLSKDFVIGVSDLENIESNDLETTISNSLSAIQNLRAGDPVLISGFPTKSQELLDQGHPELANKWVVSTGPVLTEEQAQGAISQSAFESILPYDPAVEFVTGVSVSEGISGGPVFDRFGNLLGIVVRGSLKSEGGETFSRVIRIDHILKTFKKTLGDSKTTFGTESVLGQCKVLLEKNA